MVCMATCRCGFRGEGGRPFPQVFDPLQTQRVPPLYYFEIDIHFWWRALKTFQRHLRRQYILILRGQRASKTKAIFWSKFIEKCPKTPFFGPFTQNLICGPENLAKIGAFKALGELGNQFGQPKTNVDLKQMWTMSTKMFLKIRPPPPSRKHPTSAPGHTYDPTFSFSLHVTVYTEERNFFQHFVKNYVKLRFQLIVKQSKFEIKQSKC